MSIKTRKYSRETGLGWVGDGRGRQESIPCETGYSDTLTAPKHTYQQPGQLDRLLEIVLQKIKRENINSQDG